MRDTSKEDKASVDSFLDSIDELRSLVVGFQNKKLTSEQRSAFYTLPNSLGDIFDVLKEVSED